MSKRRFLWFILTTALLVVAFLLVGQRFVLDSEKLESAINHELPVGSSKAQVVEQVVEFVNSRHPLFCDDLGSQVKARLSGLAENMIYRKDILLVFEFDSQGKVHSHSKKEYLTFL